MQRLLQIEVEGGGVFVFSVDDEQGIGGELGLDGIGEDTGAEDGGEGDEREPGGD